MYNGRKCASSGSEFKHFTCVSKNYFKQNLWKIWACLFCSSWGLEKKLLEEQSSHICHHFPNSEKMPEHQPVRNISKTWFVHLYALIPFCFSCSTGSLGNNLQKISSSPLCILCAELHPFCLKSISLDYVLERSWAGSGFRISTAPAQTRGGTHSAEPHRPETHKTQTAEQKRKSHCNSLRASLSWKYSPPKEQGNTKGFCVVILCLPADSSECWMQIHATGVEIFHCSQAALHLIQRSLMGLSNTFRLQYFTLICPKGTWLS